MALFEKRMGVLYENNNVRALLVLAGDNAKCCQRSGAKVNSLVAFMDHLG